MSVRKIKTNITESRSVPPSLPPEVVPLSGLADIVIYDRLSQDFAEAKKQAVSVIRRMIEAIVAQGALGKAKLDDIRRTYMATDQGVTAQVQLRAKGIKNLSAEDQMTLTKLKIGLRTIPGKTTLNPLYCGAAKPGETALVDDMVQKLQKLIKANPKAGIPDNLFTTHPTVTLPAEDALFKALGMGQGEREKALDILADVVVMRGDITVIEPLLKVLDQKAKNISEEINK